ncbi:MAG: AIM24 family protein, partial [Nocardioidaceae bacterium]
FNTLIQGQGTVALTSDGPPMILDCSRQPTYVDPQAAVCWSANLAPNVSSSMNMKSMIRGGSGEAMQYVFHGPGFVVVQPSEGYPIPTTS